MQRFLSLLRKELGDHLTSTSFYMMLACFYLIVGAFFYQYVLLFKDTTSNSILDAILIPMLGNVHFLLILIVPILTMKVFSDEFKFKTIEILFLSKLTSLEIVLAKFFSLLIIGLLLLLPSFFYPIFLSSYHFTEWPVVLLNYMGLFFSLGCYVSIGLFASTLTNNSILSGFISLTITMGFMFLATATRFVDNFIISKVIEYMSITSHFSEITSGVFKSNSFLFFLTIIFFFLFLTKKKIEQKRNERL